MAPPRERGSMAPPGPKKFIHYADQDNLVVGGTGRALYYDERTRGFEGRGDQGHGGREALQHPREEEAGMRGFTPVDAPPLPSSPRSVLLRFASSPGFTHSIRRFGWMEGFDAFRRSPAGSGQGAGARRALAALTAPASVAPLRAPALPPNPGDTSLRNPTPSPTGLGDGHGRGSEFSVGDLSPNAVRSLGTSSAIISVAGGVSGVLELGGGAPGGGGEPRRNTLNR